MRMPSLAPELAKAASVALAVAAIAIIGFTALADSRGATKAPPTAAPTRPAGPSPVATLPGSVDGETTPTVSAAQSRRWMRGLVGKWAQTTRDDYFQFHSNGTGEWIAYGQKLWTGTATPRNAKTFDLSDAHGEGAAYWRVTLTGRGRRLYFAGTQQTYPKARARPRTP